MASSPTLDEFQRHLQAKLKEIEGIHDIKEGKEVRKQLEWCINEVLSFKQKYSKLIEEKMKPTIVKERIRLIEEKPISPKPSERTQTEAQIDPKGDVTCGKCNHKHDGGLGFCPSCGEIPRD